MTELGVREKDAIIAGLEYLLSAVCSLDEDNFQRQEVEVLLQKMKDEWSYE